MALGINYESSTGGGEDIVPVVKYNAKAGRWTRVDREDGTNNEVDITRNFKAVFDFENVQVGSISFATGKAPDFCVVKHGERIPQPPTSEHKDGIRILVKLHNDCGGDVRELASVAKAFLRGIDALHNDYLAGSKSNPGKLPVVVMSDTVPIVSEGAKGKSTNYVPKFEITSWANRPVDLTDMPRVSAAAQGNTRNETPPSTGSTKVAPPSSSDDDFG